MKTTKCLTSEEASRWLQDRSQIEDPYTGEYEPEFHLIFEAPGSYGQTDEFVEWFLKEVALADPVLLVVTDATQVGFGQQRPDGIIRLGLGGGAARPSTGYAFSRIQAQADRVVAALTRGEVPDTSIDSRMTRFMDRVFLQVLATAPDRGPALFECLFRNAPEDRLERFLSGSTRAADRLWVMASLPPLPFLRAAAVPA